MVVCRDDTLSLETVLVPATFNWPRWISVIGMMGLAVVLGKVLWKSHRQRQPASSGSPTILIALGIVVVLASTLSGCSRTQPPLDPYHVDKGEVRQGVKVTHTFRIRNTGRKAFKVTKIVKACRCQVVDLNTDQATLPSQVLPVTLEIPTDGILGSVRNRIIITTDSDVHELESVELSLTATVVARVRAIPSQLEFGIFEGGEQVAKRLRVESSIPGVLERYIKTESDTPFLGIRLVDKQVGTLVFDVVFDESAPPGDVFGLVAIEFDHPEYSRIEARVFGRKLGKIRVVPSRITIRVVHGDEPSRSRLRLESLDKNPFRIVDIQTPAGFFVKQGVAAGESAQPVHLLDIEARANRPPQGGMQYVVIQTTRDDCPVVRIPIVEDK